MSGKHKRSAATLYGAVIDYDAIDYRRKREISTISASRPDLTSTNGQTFRFDALIKLLIM